MRVEPWSKDGQAGDHQDYGDDQRNRHRLAA
jgi:hypothetical protein